MLLIILEQNVPSAYTFSVQRELVSSKVSSRRGRAVVLGQTTCLHVEGKPRGAPLMTGLTNWSQVGSQKAADLFDVTRAPLKARCTYKWARN
jgi:hypothetical protein